MKEKIQKSLVLIFLLVLCLNFVQMVFVSSATAQTFPVTITDDAGRTVTIYSEPQRIVSLSPAHTETLFALGLGDRVVGVTQYCDYPPELETLVQQGNITIIGGFTTPNVEAIIGLNPDLVLGHKLMGEDNLAALENAGITVLVFEPEDIDGIYSMIERVGMATGSQDAAKSLVDAMKARIDAVKQKVSQVEEKVRVVQMCWLEPIWAAGDETFINAAIEAAGGINVLSDQMTGYNPVSPEVIIEENPDIIVYTSMALDVSASEVKSKIVELLEPTSAVKNDKIYLLLGDAASMLERPGPGLVDGVETLAKIFYPQLYGGYMPKIITERKVTISYYTISEGYSKHQLKALTEAKNLLKIKGDIKEAYEKLIKTGIITDEIPPIPKDSPTYTMLIQLYGENLEKYPTVEGRIQLLYAMGLLKIES